MDPKKTTSTAATAAKRALRAAHKSAAPPAGSGAHGEHWVTMSTALTRAAHCLTLSEKRIVAMAIGLIDSKKRRPIATSISDVPVTRITASEYAETFDVDIDTAYNQLEDASKNLYQRSITYFEPSHIRKSAAMATVRMRWIGAVKYQKGEGWIELQWWPQTFRELTNLRQNFSSYQLRQASALRSVYSWKLLELLNRFKSTGWAEYTIEDFSESMEATPKQRANFAMIERDIIKQAIKELTEKDNWIIKLTKIKAGRRVARLRFDFERNPQMQLI